MVLMNNIRGALLPALDSVMTCHPDYVVMGMSAETFWDGLEGSAKLQRKLEKRAKTGVAMGSDACQAALDATARASSGSAWSRRTCRSATARCTGSSPTAATRS